MHKKSFFYIRCFLLTTLAVMVSLLSCTEPTPKVYRVGIVTDFSPFMIIADNFKAGMTELGYIEGKNIVYDLQVKDFDPEGQKAAVQQFIKDKVDLIFTFPTEATVIAHRNTLDTEIPVVFAMCGVEGNLPIESVQQPGGNITGVRYPGPDKKVKHLEQVIEIKPGTRRVWITCNPNYPNTNVILKTMRNAAARLNLELVVASNTTLDGVKTDLKKLEDSGEVSSIDFILFMPEGLSQNPEVSQTMIDFGYKYNIPVGGGVPFTLDQGAIFSFIPDSAEMGKLAAPLAHKIFNGITAGTIPLVTPENYLWLNLKAFKKLGLTANEGLLFQAKHVIRE